MPGSGGWRNRSIVFDASILHPAGIPIQHLLAEYFEIDLEQAEAEHRDAGAKK